jgi:hypothetical protein
MLQELNEARHDIASGLNYRKCIIDPCRVQCPLWVDTLQKAFWGDERKFLKPLVRFTRGEVRDHIVLSKIDHGPP